MDKVICHCGKEIQTSVLIQSDDEDDKTTIKTVSLEWFDDNLKRDRPYEYAWKKKNNFI